MPVQARVAQSREAVMRAIALVTPLRRALVIALVATAPSASTAAQEVDHNVVRLEWGVLNILVIKDTLNGVGLWAAWSATAAQRGIEADEFVAHYDPPAVLTWLDEVRLLLAPTRANESDPPQAQTPPLTDLQDGRLVAVRLKDGRRWGNRMYFSMSYHPREKPLQFAVETRHVPRLLDALAAGARDSRWVATPVSGGVPLYSNPAHPSIAPEGAGVRGVVYPEFLVERKIQGDVWFTFVVDSTGAVQMDDGFRILLSDHPALSETARESVRDGRYRPAYRAGRPMPVRVYQRVMYRIREY
jgi:hypothetical protein